MNRSKLEKVVAESAGIKNRDAEKLIDAFCDTITTSLQNDEKIVYSNFGTFYKVHYPSKVILHPILGAKKKMIMLPTDVVKWMPSENIKDMVNYGKKIDNMTGYGAGKMFKAVKKKEGLPEGKAIEMTDKEIAAKSQPIEEEIYDIPVKYTATKKKENTETAVVNDQTPDSLIPITISKSKTENITKESPAKPDKPNADDLKANFWDQFFKKPEADLKPITHRQKTVDYVELSNTIVPENILLKIPEDIAHNYRMAPIEESDEELTIAMIDPDDLEAIAVARKLAKKKIVRKLTTEKELGNILNQYKKIRPSKEKEDNVAPVDKSTKAVPAARIVSSILKRAIREDASDIHIEPIGATLLVRFRIRDILHKKISLEQDIRAAVISRIKALANLELDEQHLPQDGQFNMKIENRQIDFRVSTIPIASGEKIVIRVISKLTRIVSINELGLEEKDLKIVNTSCQKKSGMIFVAGPDDSVKTSSLYSLVDSFLSENINIMTLEDPIEYQVAGINQSQINENIGYTFTKGLESILRQDPDVIMLSKMTDTETAKMALQAAQNGRIVVSTASADDTAKTITWLLSLGVEPLALSSSLNLIISQRAVGKICEKCKEKTAIDETTKKMVLAEIGKMSETVTKTIKTKDMVFYEGKGCKQCDGTGYSGKLGLFEVLELSDEIRNLVAKAAPSGQIRDAAVKNGMTTLVQDGIIKSLEGKTSISEVLRIAK